MDGEMTDTAGGTEREVVGVFDDKKHFDGAVKALLKAGFERADLSVLASHESLEAAEAAVKHGVTDTIVDTLKALTGELKFAGPLGAAGIVILIGGPVISVVGGLIAAGIGGLALREVLSEVLAHPHHEHFERAVEAGGIILWVHVDSDDAEARATSVLAKAGGENVHTHAPTA